MANPEIFNQPRIITPQSPEWPFLWQDKLPISFYSKARGRNTGFGPLPDHLNIIGELAPERRRIAIIGSRDATKIETDFASKIAQTCTDSGFAVVSGLAIGIDWAAHFGALQGRGLDGYKGLTYAVLPSKLPVVYPQDHLGFAKRIAGQGALISEYETPPTDGDELRIRLITRNRITLAMAEALIVVCGQESSGTHQTLELALALGMPVGIFNSTFLAKDLGHHYLKTTYLGADKPDQVTGLITGADVAAFIGNLPH